MTHRFQPGIEYTMDVVCDVELTKRNGQRCDAGTARLVRLDPTRCGLLMAAAHGVYACDLCKQATSARNLIWFSPRANGVDLCDNCIQRGMDAGWGPLKPLRRRGDEHAHEAVYSLAALQRIFENRLTLL